MDTVVAIDMSAHFWDEPTVNLKFIDGKLHQLFIVHGATSEGQVTSKEWRIVPSDTTPETGS